MDFLRLRRRRQQRARRPDRQAPGLSSGPVAPAAAWSLLEAVVDSTPDAILVLELDGTVTGLNRAATEMFGHGAAEAASKPFAMLVPGQTRADVERLLEDVRQGRRSEPLETRLLRRDGSLVDVALTLSPVRDAAGKVVAGSAVVRDLSRRRRTQEELRRVHDLLERAEGLAGYGSWEWDGDEPRLRPSRGFCVMHGMAPDCDLLDLDTILARVEPEDRARLASFFRQPPGEHPDGVEYRVRIGDGLRSYHALLHVDPQDRRAGRVVGLVQDVTQSRLLDEARRQAARQEAEIERLRETDAFKTRFLNMAAHELATPLTPIRIQLELLQGQQVPPGATRSLVVVRRNVERLARVIQDVLDAARIQAGRLFVRRQPGSLRDVVRTVAEGLRSQAERGQVELRWDCSTPASASFDPGRLAQVVTNLVGNAVKFTPPGGRVAVRCAETRDEVLLSVADTGIGLSKEAMERLFQPYTQVHDPQEWLSVGNGLGLYISRGIVEAHGGRLWAESAGPGQGTTMHVALPREAPVPPVAP